MASRLVSSNRIGNAVSYRTGNQLRRLYVTRAAAKETTSPTSSCLGTQLRSDFPILHQKVGENPLVYLDNSATSQKPLPVLRAMDEYYEGYNSNVHRGVHHLAAKATQAYEESRQKVANLIHAESDREIVFTRGASEAINLIANTWGAENIKQGEEIVLTVMEHHSNLVPWQLLSQRTGAKLKFCRMNPETQELDMDHMKEIITDKTKLVGCVHVSNMLGCINPVEEIASLAHAKGAKLLVDACQSVPHMPIDVQTLGADWIVASAHKMCGPTGIGFLWGRYDLLDTMPPWMGGGEMIADVYLDHSTYAAPPARFEAGTPAIAEAIGLGAACDYLSTIGMEKVHEYETELGNYLYARLAAVDGVTIYGPNPTTPTTTTTTTKESAAAPRAGLCSFNVEGLHATDISTILDHEGVAVRSGHHCTQPLHRELDIPASARASVYIYNTKEEVDVFVDALDRTIKFFKEMEGME